MTRRQIEMVYGGLPPHEPKAVTETSRQAAIEIMGQAATLRGAVYRFIRDRGARGATDDEVEHATGLKHQTASARRRELYLADLICDSGLRRNTRSGRKATVWVVKP